MSIIDKLKSLGSAEEFFEVLQVEYQPEVLQVLRLHILRRMGQYLVSAEFDGMSEEEIYSAAQTMLGQAYEDFIKSNPMAERVFKVLKEHDPTRPATPAAKPAFVQLGSLKTGS
ncbi:nitrogenase stabilizing/protective protein NifW [Xanthobacter autotrophicus DSM 597]|uniref:nitrogenase stabilizing/protective protein NifW n=1 Tax=Xanthobacter TaxID=279 RepID=UPI001AE225F6|nr:nitrogenase stabilizing/protective protein NifW [Xanthobacter flavus]MBP2149250.1 nitrogenase-stabilizing/protective protein [Xanthobacter flavus]